MPRHKLSQFEQEARNTIASNLKKYMHGMTQADLANKVNIPVTTLSGYLRAKSTPNAENLEKLATALNVRKSDIDPRYSFNDIMDFVNNAPSGNYRSPGDLNFSNKISIDQSKVRSIPLIGTIAMGTPITAEQNVERYIPEYFIGDVPDGTLFKLKCKGESMEPTIPNGAIALIREQPTVEDDEIAAVLIDGEATLKRIRHSGNKIILVPDNREYTPIILDENNPGRILGKLLRYTVDFE